MNCKNMKKIVKIPFLALLAIVLSVGTSFALTVELAAVEATWTPPDGSGPVSMWAYVDTSPDTAAAYTCPGAPVAWDVGPVITVPNNDNLIINLRNCLSEDVSIFIPGQVKTTVPVNFTDGQGRTRVSSFDSVVTPGGTGTYTWDNPIPKEGTYLYQSGTFVAKQVPKGLYGALVVLDAGGNYPPPPPITQEEILVYSEIDPVLNNAGVGARINNYQPKYFLINGETYPNTANIAVNTGDNVLLRFVNAGLRTYVPTLQNLYMSVIAEDGNILPYALDSYQIELTAAKTMDAIVNVGSEGRYALYDRSLHLTDMTVNGGMLTYIVTPTIVLPVATPDTYYVGEGTVLTVAAPGVLDNDTGTGLTAYQTGPAPPGALTLNTDGSLIYTPVGAAGIVETFQYYASDGSYNSGPALVTINILSLPVASNDFFTVSRNIASTIDIAAIIANDIDPNSGGFIDPDTVVLSSATTARGGTVINNDNGTITYTPEGGGGPDYFRYTVNDNFGITSNEATVRVNRVETSPAPAAVPNSLNKRGRVKSR